MKPHVRIEKNYPLAVVPFFTRRNTAYGKEWLIYWFNFRLSIIWY